MSDLEIFVDFLKCVLESMSGAEAHRQGCSERLEQKYQNIINLNKEEDFYKFLKQEYGDDQDIYIGLLQYICEMPYFNERWIEFLRKKLKQEFEEEDDFFVELNLWDQIRSQLFMRGQKLSFLEQWEINERIAGNMAKTFPFAYEKIDKADRDNNFVVLFAQTILSTRHAPTRIIVEIARAIQKYLKKRVLIISAVVTTDKELLAQREITGYLLNTKMIDHRGAFRAEYKGEYIDAYQIIIEKNNALEIKRLMDEIYGLKPFCVWNLAADPAFSSIAKQWTTSVYTLMNQGYPPVDADYIVRYLHSDTEKEEEKANKEFLLKKNIKIIETDFMFQYEEPKKNLQRKDFGIPDSDAFVLGVVGTRLLGECTNEFLEILDRIAERDKNIFVLFLGFKDEKNISKFEKRLQDSMKNLSNYKLMTFKDDIIEYMTFIDLFVNPPRVGGGTCGGMALSLGIPAVTLKACDIASVVGENYTVDTLDEYTELILKYKNDSEFYKCQSKLAVKRIKEQTMDDEEFASVIQDIFDRIDQGV